MNVTASARRPLVLLVDDDPAVRFLATQTLEAAGFQVVAAENGAAALQEFQRVVPDIVLSDVEMPEIDGFELCAAVRGRSLGRETPFVLMTGHDDAESVNRAYDIGATDFINKPIPWLVLPNRVRYILRASQAFGDLKRSEQRNRSLLAAIPDMIFIVNRAGIIEEYLSGHGHTQEPQEGNWVNKPLEEILPPDAAQRARESIHIAMATGKPQTYEHNLEDGRRWFESRLIAHGEDSVMAIVRDITDLPNRQQFVRELERAIGHAQRMGQGLATLYIDLDHFKRINDTFGHSLGDALLKSVAKRLGSCVRPLDYVARAAMPDTESDALSLARLGGDEFVILIGDVDDEATADGIARRIRDDLRAPFSFDDHQFVITPSIGIALYPEHGEDMETLLMNADAAMYRAKAAGRNGHRFFSSTMTARSLERLELEQQIREALDEEAFELHYQPKIDLADGRVVGVEALLRWQHAERGWVSPGQFIPIAEETGLIVPLGNWVIRQACSQLKDWQTAGIDDISVAVNVSSHQFLQQDLHETILRAIWEAGISPERVELEITESLLMRDVDDTIATLRAFRDAGLRLTVDDFGTGYSSLSYLKQFPLHTLKVDRSFVKDMHVDRDDAAICAAIIAMAKELGLMVVAEGIELQEQLEALRAMNCDQVQGFLFSKPLPVEELVKFLQAPASRQILNASVKS
jgi:predicted signal transduction protein with EAL and GGDEF domain/FixJ family two-component response regulator